MYFKDKLLKNRLFRDSLWAVIGNFAGRGISLISGIFIAKILGKDVFGEFTFIKNTVISFSILSTFGLGYTSTKFIAEQILTKPLLIQQTISNVSKITFIFSSIISFLIFLFSERLSIVFLDSPQLNLPLKIVSIWIIFNALTTSQIGILAGIGKYKSLAKINVIVGITLFILSIILCLKLSLIGAILALLLSQILNFVLNLYSINSWQRLNPVPRVGPFKFDFSLVKFSVPITLQEFAYGISILVTSYVVIKYSNYGELGIYNAAAQISSIILYVPSILRNVILSHFSQSVSNTDYKFLLLKRVFIFTFLITLIPVIFVISFSKIVVGFYGESFGEIEDLIFFAALNAIFASLGNVCSQFYISIGKNWSIFALRFYRDIISLLIFLICLNIFHLSKIALCLIQLNLFFQASFLAIAIFYINILRKSQKIADKK